MKIKILLSTLSILSVAFLFMSNSGGRAAVGSGDNTGAPPSNAFCQSCHNAGAFSPSVSIEIFEQGTSTAVTEYISGTAYDVKITVTAGSGTPAGFGQQTTVLDANNNAITGWSNPSSDGQISNLGNGRQFFEQNGISSSGEFTATWTAPAAGTGSVTFYTGANAVDGLGSTGGDGSTQSSLTLAEGVASNVTNPNALTVNLNAYPNPVTDVLNLETVGTTSGEHILTITNNVGQVVRQQIIQLNYGMDLNSFNVSELTSGIYRVSLSQKDKIATITVLKQ